MKNKNISDFVAASMNAVLNSEQHKSLFNTQYKFASDEFSSDENDARAKKNCCKECGCKLKNGKCIKCDSSDSSSAWDSSDMNDVMGKDSCPECGEDADNCYCMPADDNYVEESMSSSVPNKTTVAFNIALDSLLTASAALDSVGMDNGSNLSLKLASLVVEAKKKMSPEEKKKLMERLQKGKKGKKPGSSSSSSRSSSSSSSVSSKKKSKTASYLKSLASFEDEDEDEEMDREIHKKLMAAKRICKSMGDQESLSRIHQALEAVESGHSEHSAIFEALYSAKPKSPMVSTIFKNVMEMIDKSATSAIYEQPIGEHDFEHDYEDDSESDLSNLDPEERAMFGQRYEKQKYEDY